MIIMKKTGLTRYVILGMAMAISVAGCKEDNNDELIRQEMQLLQEYLANNNITQEPTESGLYYIPLVEGTGMQPTQNTWIDFEFTGMLIDGTIFATSDEGTAEEYNIGVEGQIYGPVRAKVGNLPLSGLREGLQLMKVGETAQLIIPSSLALGGSGSPDVPSYSTLIYTIELLDAFDDPAAHEQQKIWEYLAENQFDELDSTESGLYYIREKPGNGPVFRDGNVVAVTYSGQYLDGREFDTNVGSDPLTLMVPSDEYIEGWNEGIKLMRDQEEGILIIPYKLGYDKDGRKNQFGVEIIPPYTTLVYYMKTEKAS
jgi:FKBP-type peptidyl-prolyl cis-trans isomerase